jgi:hypothetical protein
MHHNLLSKGKQRNLNAEDINLKLKTKNMKRLVMLLMIISLSSCKNNKKSSIKSDFELSSSPNTSVEICRKDSVVIYKLWDDGRIVYFTNKGGISR